MHPPFTHVGGTGDGNPPRSTNTCGIQTRVQSPLTMADVDAALLSRLLLPFHFLPILLSSPSPLLKIKIAFYI